MRKILLSVMLLGFATVASAQHYHTPRVQHRHYHNGGNVWVPLLGGAIAGAVIYDIYNRPVAVQPPVIVNQSPAPVYVTPPAVVYDCVDTIKPSSVPGNEHYVRTCTPRAQ